MELYDGSKPATQIKGSSLISLFPGGISVKKKILTNSNRVPKLLSTVCSANLSIQSMKHFFLKEKYNCRSILINISLME